MGYDLHVTRSKHWTESESQPITREDWQAYVASDPEIEPDTPGDYFEFAAHPKEPALLQWWRGEITVKNPDRPTVRKLLEIASKLGAQVQGEDGEFYTNWEEFPDDPSPAPIATPETERGVAREDKKGQASEFRFAKIILKRNRIYIFPMAVVANSFDTVDACYAQHEIGVAASLLGRDVLAAMRASGRHITSEEFDGRAKPLLVVFGPKIDSRFWKRSGVVNVEHPKPTDDILVMPLCFRGATGFPVTESKVGLPKDVNAEQLGAGILEKLFESQQMNS
jgi:hypothetical protein